MNRGPKQKPRGKPFQKGVSGNPGGRPRYSEISQAMRHLLTLSLEELKNYAPEKVAEKIAIKQIREAMAGEFDSVNFVTNRAEGLPTARIFGSLNLSDTTLEISILEPPTYEIEAKISEEEKPIE